ncbi:MAG: hypothetical protein JWO15_3680 [Sphingomonadales bacterium]|nr:hypothetical protein [Sphingomonadales bacterium]
MADFTPRTFEQIIEDMVAYVQNHSELSDFTPGSANRTLLEAAALEDDEAYFQMTQILAIFSIFTARGEKLERRLADFGIVRDDAKAATGRVRFFDGNLITDRVALDANVGAGTLYLFDTSKLPTNGYPYVVRIGESTSRTQDITVTFNNTSTNLLTLGGPLAFNAIVGDRVSLVTGTTAHTINAGYQIIVPASSSSAAKMYATQEQAFIDAGNYFSNEVIAKSTTPGAAGNVASGKVSQFLGGTPFSGAGVFSTTAMGGGREQEKDEDLVQRAIEQIQGLSRGTPLALKSAAKTVEDATTGQRVLSSNLIENFDDNEVVLYIDDGSGFVADYVSLPVAVLSAPASGTVITVDDGSKFATAGSVLIDDGSTNDLVEFTARSGNSIQLATTTSHSAGADVSFVDVVSLATESTQRRFRLNNFPIVRNTETIYKFTGTKFVPMLRGVDYILNKGTGEFMLTTALPAGSKIIANYAYYINLVKSVQRLLEGDQNDEVNFPGVKAAGIFLTVEAPAVRRINIRLSLSAKPGYTEADLYDAVRASVEQYITSLRLGDDVVVSRIVDAVHDNEGVFSVTVVNPTQNLTVLENELPVPFDSSGNSLIVIT